MLTTRLSRIKQPTDFKSGKKGILDLFDDWFKDIYRVNDDEYDYIASNATDEELNLLIQDENFTFAEKRKCIEIINKYLTEINNKN